MDNRQPIVLTWGSIEEKAGQMRGLATIEALQAQFKNEVRKIASSANIKNITTPQGFIKLLEAIFENYVYSQDPFIELYQFPTEFLKSPIGDCDDITITLASVATMARVPNELVFIFQNRTLKHVFLRITTGNRTLNIDPTKPNPENWITESGADPIPEQFNKNIVRTVAEAILIKNSA